MAARSISSRPNPSFSSSSSLARSPSSLSSPRGGYSFSSGYTTSGFSFSSYISSSASGYSSLASPTPVVLRRKTSGLSRQEYKTRSKSVDASQIFQAGEIHQLERAKTPCSLDRSLSTERASGGNTRVPARKSSVYGFTDRSRDCSVSRASSEVPELEVGDLAEEKVRTKPVRNRQSHGVSQFDLERAATWAMIGSNKSPGPLQPQPVLESAVVENSETNQIDYKKLWEESQAENARLRLEINTVRFDLEVARRQLVRVKEEKLCQVERIFVVQKIAKLEDDLKESPRLQSENKKLLSENKALSRVVTKLSIQ